MPGSPRPATRRKRQGSPHPEARRRRQGSPHPNAISEISPGCGSTSPDQQSSAASSPLPGPQVIPEQIPDLLSIAPAIFTPATYDYTQARPLSTTTADDDTTKSTTERVDRAMAELESHITAVKRNIATMVMQQARKIHQDSAAAELHFASQNDGVPPRSRRLPPTRADEEALIRSLEEPRVPGRTYGLPSDFGWAMVEPVAPHSKDTPREAAVTRFVELMRYGMMQMEGYEAHCEGVRKEKKAQIAKEVAEELARSLAGPTNSTAEAVQNTGGEVDDFGIAMDLNMD